MRQPVGGREWDDVLGGVLELAEGAYATLVLAGLGGLLGLGAAVLLDIPGWVGAAAGGVLVPLLVVLLLGGVSREEDR